ncbi:MAG: putative rho GTPase activating protein 39 [Streblomastix strix]|uniref:Putative rho GTPase activating protein 39 n=1 Tax=Streblomastix strix TaxID=222440 RepID=A0A5J4WRC7_9EUKA|nr:MAG: putative rho GTPase activating protein 39 [Streblomastix strix]
MQQLVLTNFDNILTYQGIKGNIKFEQIQGTVEQENKRIKLLTQIAQQIVNLGYSNESLRNEIFCQLIKQTTIGSQTEKELKLNILQDALRRGWQLIMLCCETFAPQTNFESIILAHIEKAMDAGHISTEGAQSTVQEEISMFATYSLNKLLTTFRFGGILKVDEKKISDIQSITRIRRVFDCSLADIMFRQSTLAAPEKDFLVPTVLLFLINRIIQTNGLRTEGIFRESFAVDETENAIALLNLGYYGNQFFRSQTNPHSYAVLLLNWLKRLEDPIIPSSLYEKALDTVRPLGLKKTSLKLVSPCEFVNYELPLANILTLKCLSRFLKKVYAEENVRYNLMAVQNVALIFAPTLIKSKSEDSYVNSKNLRLEISFIMTVILEIGNLTRDEESKIAEAEKWVLDNYCKTCW